ncbi:hypothetical protein H5410_041044 [Solanum commersonii]|uniref:Uncharacterized protein n=1 Tax=Solanum commersonii TaxID=4109 RepID=A0A9J5XRX1_SOLCO|nr:hypothetical protein H5410_041044 [Solanum commersonii]
MENMVWKEVIKLKYERVDMWMTKMNQFQGGKWFESVFLGGQMDRSKTSKTTLPKLTHPTSKSRPLFLKCEQARIPSTPQEEFK